MITKSQFKPAWWLKNPHAQTIYPTLNKCNLNTGCIEQIDLPDGDCIDLMYSSTQVSDTTPLIVLLHGLGGNMHSGYVARLFSEFTQQGWQAVIMHFRGALKPNRLARAYHAGDTTDFSFILNYLQQQSPNRLMAAVGISLGGNVLLKWLGEHPQQTFLTAAVAVSVPFQLRVVANRMNQGFARFYQKYLIDRLKKVFKRKPDHYQGTSIVTLEDIENSNCFWTFDDKVIAKLHGFPHVHAYYQEASSRSYLKLIQTPTLIIHALDDPFMSPHIIPTEEELSGSVNLELSKRGGHVGFITGKVPGKPIYWLNERISNFLKPFFKDNHNDIRD